MFGRLTEHCSRSVVTSETGLAHTRSVQQLAILFKFDYSLRRRQSSEKEESVDVGLATL